MVCYWALIFLSYQTELTSVAYVNRRTPNYIQLKWLPHIWQKLCASLEEENIFKICIPFSTTKEEGEKKE